MSVQADHHRRSPAVLRVVEDLREGIKSGRYAPGQRLVETDLCEEYGISRGPVREALRRLETEGLVELTANRGAAVRRMSREDAAEMITARAILEGGVARLAAGLIDEPGNRSRLEQHLAESQRLAAAGDGVRYAEANERFHFAIAEISGNRLLETLITRVQIYTYRVLYVQFLSHERIPLPTTHHEEIAAAIFAGDGACAEEAMRRHIVDTGDSILALSPPLFR